MGKLRKLSTFQDPLQHRLQNIIRISSYGIADTQSSTQPINNSVWNSFSFSYSFPTFRTLIQLARVNMFCNLIWINCGNWETPHERQQCKLFSWRKLRLESREFLISNKSRKKIRQKFLIIELCNHLLSDEIHNSYLNMIITRRALFRLNWISAVLFTSKIFLFPTCSRVVNELELVLLNELTSLEQKRAREKSICLFSLADFYDINYFVWLDMRFEYILFTYKENVLKDQDRFPLKSLAS